MCEVSTLALWQSMFLIYGPIGAFLIKMLSLSIYEFFPDGKKVDCTMSKASTFTVCAGYMLLIFLMLC